MARRRVQMVSFIEIGVLLSHVPIGAGKSKNSVAVGGFVTCGPGFRSFRWGRISSRPERALPGHVPTCRGLTQPKTSGNCP